MMPMSVMSSVVSMMSMVSMVSMMAVMAVMPMVAMMAMMSVISRKGVEALVAWSESLVAGPEALVVMMLTSFIFLLANLAHSILKYDIVQMIILTLPTPYLIITYPHF